MNLRTACISALLGCASLASWAQTPPVSAARTPGIDAHQRHQQARIHQGMASGALTAHEARGLHREQRVIRHAEAFAKADGVVTAKERAHLRHLQQKASHHIRNQKHDARQRHGLKR
jgi:uncharacterized membrane protein YebE (DUF533 family)